jgi:hypothetical protein
MLSFFQGQGRGGAGYGTGILGRVAAGQPNVPAFNFAPQGDLSLAPDAMGRANAAAQASQKGAPPPMKPGSGFGPQGEQRGGPLGMTAGTPSMGHSMGSGMGGGSGSGMPGIDPEMIKTLMMFFGG